MNKSFNPDHLKPFSEVLKPDPRSGNFGNPETLERRTLEDHYTAVSQYTLSDAVPDAVTTLFETAKNIWLYAWFAYRFYPVAEHQAITALEMGLKGPIGPLLPKKSGKTLAPLLKCAADHGLIRNEHFTTWHRAVQQRAIDRYDIERIREMERLGIQSYTIDHTQAVPNDEDRNIDYVGHLIKSLPDQRNSYAHGSRTLHNNPSRIFLVVTEILNQVYSREP